MLQCAGPQCNEITFKYTAQWPNTFKLVFSPSHNDSSIIIKVRLFWGF